MKTNDLEHERIAYNTEQFEQIVLIKSGLDAEFADKDEIFVAGDLIWFPDAQESSRHIVPDVMVVARPKAQREAYRQWLEDGIAPLVVFEIAAPADTFTQLLKKYKFYEQYGVQEYYLLRPENQTVEAWIRHANELIAVENIHDFQSPSLGITFKVLADKIEIYHSNGRKFETYSEISARTEKRNLRRREAHRRLTGSKIRMMVQKLREMGVNPDDLDDE